MAQVEAAAQKAASKALAAKEAMKEKANEEAEYAQRLRTLGWKLGDVLLMAEAGSLAKDPSAPQGIGGPSSLLALENGGGLSGRSWDQAGTGPKKEPPLPSAGLLTILRPAMRALDARLHALRAECKASGMRHAGNLAGGQGEDLLPRQSLQPLDELITEVISRIDTTGKSLHFPGTQQILLPPAALRQKEVLHLEDSRWNSSGTAVNAEAGRGNLSRRQPNGQATTASRMPPPARRQPIADARPMNPLPPPRRDGYAVSETASSI